ncbi:Pyridine nucleotide-disulphide oxidoreductase [Natronoarchaeum philippinense]|uniref:Pyridine nucleotide-disulphide oxidoreductase n=1 Tax=Natronoarchaeum philippinense TaxID=558529 RepID=A0A285NUC5_NATPI|nr:NAD(P)/FAD-dependent oxidoreductase [Natronoarchaeum philippinense]SNZ13080.1 Pyridine nucleotide-disulphide oxidoreductase [Natronoarchaeum philippinense]
MTNVAVVGGGPAGLSTALFTAKNGLDTVVFDGDETWMHKAHLFNYPGIRSLSGDEYMAIARGQAEDYEADVRTDEEVTEIEQTDDGFSLTTEDGEYDADYVVLATGADRSLAEDLGCDFSDDDTVDVNLSMETSVDDLYATGAMVRAEEWQAVIAAGDGGAAALSILSDEKGEHYHDFDVPDDAP